MNINIYHILYGISVFWFGALGGCIAMYLRMKALGYHKKDKCVFEKEGWCLCTAKCEHKVLAKGSIYGCGNAEDFATEVRKVSKNPLQRIFSQWKE